MNLYAGSNLSSMMRPLFWKKMSPMSFWANYQRQYFLCKSNTPIGLYLSLPF